MSLSNLIRRYVCFRDGHMPSKLQTTDTRGRVICLRCHRPCKRAVLKSVPDTYREHGLR